jgi:anti-sigma28 factor (negative regulator of flagellin synthesis)
MAAVMDSLDQQSMQHLKTEVFAAKIVEQTFALFSNGALRIDPEVVAPSLLND